MAEKEYIPREAAIKATCFNCSKKNICGGVCDDTDRLRSIPAADVRPVVRGKWKYRRFAELAFGFECSVCHTTWDTSTYFCPNCGADMR